MLPIRREAFSWILLLLSLAASIEQSQSNEARVVCYYTNWSIYRPGTAKFSPQNINPYLCTHLIYAFGGFTKDNQLKPFDKYQDIEKGGYAKFNGLKTYNKNLKTILAIGGWNEGSSRFSAMVASPDRRREFVKNAVKFLRQNHFDGLDLDWEYPAFRDGGKPRDKENYAKFVQELREEFNRESEKTGRSRLLLTMAVPAGTEYIQKGYDIPKLNKYLDWFNLLTYDYHSAFEPSTAHHSPLFALEKASEYNFDSELNIDYTIKFYINEGADPSKLVLGIPTYGRSYTLLNEESTDMGAPTDGPGAQGDATREKGYLAYYEICQSIKEDDAWTVVQPNPSAMGPYAFRENLWVGYDDEAIARAKGEYVVANGLGGIMFWSIDNDDFRGTCHGRPYPIIEAAKEALNRESGSENDVITPAKRKKPSRSRSRINSNSKTNNVNSDQDEEKTIQRRPTARRTKPTPKPVVKEAVEYSSPNSKKRTTTPEPPTTPNPGADFKCEEEGFFPNPQDCKKYFWCLDSGPSNLGIVAHHFTCPSGLIFNKLTDSCDYARNVICEKPKTTTQSATTESTTKKSSTAKSIIIGRPSTTTPAQSEEEEEEEYDEEEDEPVDVKTSVNTKLEHALEEEDPEVIKELITLIKKVGGLDELEKQLQMRLNLNENSAIVGTGGKTTTTTVSPISQSQSYNKVLGTKRGNLRSQKVFGSTQSNGDVEPLVQRQNKENRYSSVIRNSRPRPQNDGLDKLPEVEGGGLMRERPQYTTITRTQAPKSQQESEDEENENNNRFSVTQSSNGEAFEEDDNGPTTHQPVYNYVNIQRARPSSTAAPVEDEESGNESDDEADDEDEDEEVMSVSVNPTTTSKMHYVNIQRIRPTKQHYISDEIESETPVPETKYKAVSRKRPTTTQISIIEQDDEKLGANRYSSPTTTASSTTESATIKPIRKYSKSTTVTPTTIKPTTYHHVFAIDYDENPLESKRNQTPNEIGHDDPNASVISKKVEKLAEVNRIVEVYSQQRRQTIQRSSNGKQKSQTSNLIIERLPTVNKLGEINRVTLIKLVDHQNDTKPTAKEFITFLTTTARPAIDDDDTETVKKEKKSRQIFLPDSIFSVETSTIPLEGLFQTDRNGKRLNIVYATTADDSNLQSSPSSVFIPQTTTDTPFAQTTVVANGANDEFGDTTADSVNDIHVVNVKQSNAIPNDSATPLVISLSNLDSVQLLSPLSSTKQNATTKLTKANAYDGAVASSGKVRPQYRPGFRRPTITVSKKSKPTQSNDITDTTESSFSVTTRKSLNNNNPYVRRRSRPTYIPTTSHTTVAAIASTVANRNNDTIVNKILQRRKFGRPSSAPVSVDAAGTVTNTASERKRVTQTKTRPTTESAATVENLRRTQNPYFRRRYAYTSTTKSPKTTTIEPETISVSGIGTARHSSDQEHEPSIVDRKFSQSNQIDLGTEIISQGLGEAITSISRAPLPFVASTTVRNVKITTPGAIKYNNDDSDYQISKRADSPPNRSIKPLERQHLSSTVGPDLLLPHSEIHDSQARPSRDFKRTEKVIRTFSRINLNSDPSAKVSASLKDKPKKIAYRPVNEYDYYDDGDSIIGKSTSKVKVILHDAGIIECLDQGNFPHPLSCRKFISCAKMEIGGVVGWEYTCPKGLSYDPVGGICNWAAGLGCKE